MNIQVKVIGWANFQVPASHGLLGEIMGWVYIVVRFDLGQSSMVEKLKSAYLSLVLPIAYGYQINLIRSSV